MSRTFSINSGSFDSLNVSVRCGCSPKRAPDLVDRCVSQPARLRHPPSAPMRCAVRVSSRVRTITCSICSSVIRRGAPGRGSSYNPSRRSRRNRPRHLHTVVCDTRNRFATSLLSTPSAHARMIRARRARCGAVAGAMGQRIEPHAFLVCQNQTQPLGVPVACSPPCRRVPTGPRHLFHFLLGQH